MAERGGREVPGSEAECVEAIVYCLLTSKSVVLSTPSVQVSINTSVIQVAKSNFALVATSIFACLSKRPGSEANQLGLLRLLCQVLETRRADAGVEVGCALGGEAGGGTLSVHLATSLTNHLVGEVVKLPADDLRQSAACDVLVELAPVHPGVVLDAVLARLEAPSAAAIAAAAGGGKSQGGGAAEASRSAEALVRVLTEIAYTTPHAADGRFFEITSKYLPLLQSCKAPEMKLLLFRAWCSLCVAIVNCAVSEPGEGLSSTESGFSRAFGAAALSLRRRGAAPAAPGGARASTAAAGGVGPDDRQKATQAVGTAFSLLLSSWQGTRDFQTRVNAMEALGHLSLVIPKEQFLRNADSLLELLVNLLTRQSTGLPPMRLMRGLCLFLQACIDADPEILVLENTLQTLTSTLFAWMVSSGPLQSLQGSVGTESLQSQAEVLRCFEVLADTFQPKTLEFLLTKVKGNRDEKLSSLLVLRHLIGSAGWRPSPAAVIDSLRHLAATDGDPAVGLLLGELVAALAGADFFQVSESTTNSTRQHSGEESGVRNQQVHALLSFLINQTAMTQAPEPEQSFAAKLVAKSQHADAPSCHEVRGRAGLVLGHLADTLKPSVRLVLWPMLLQAIVNPTMRPGLPVLCRAAAQIAAGARAMGEESAKALADLASAFRPGHERSTQPEALLIWLLLCAHSPHEVPGLGLNVLRCMEALSPFINRVLGEIWEAPSRRLKTLCNYLEENSSSSRFDAEFWASALSQEVHFFLSALPEHDDLPVRLVDILGALHTEVWGKQRDMCDLSELQRAALFNLTGACLGHIGRQEKVNERLEFVISHSSDLIVDMSVRRACARGLGGVAQRHFDLVLGVLGRSAKTDAATRRTGSLAQSWFGKSAAVQQAELLRATLALALGYCAVYAPSPEVLQEQVVDHILSPLYVSLTQERTLPILQCTVEAVRLVGDAIRGSPESLAQRDPFLLRAAGKEGLTLLPDSKMCEALGTQRDNLVRALLPFLEPPLLNGQDDEQKMLGYDEMICPVLYAASSLISIPLDLPSDLYASALEAGLRVLVLSVPNDVAAPRQSAVLTEDAQLGVEPAMASRIQAATSLVKSLLIHAHSWLGVSRLLQAVHKAGASCSELVRWTATQLLGVLCTAAPILELPQEGETDQRSDVGDWCECLALLLPRTGDSYKPVVAAAIDAAHELLSRCEWTAGVRISTSADAAAAEGAFARSALEALLPADREAGLDLGGALATPPQQLVAALVARLPPAAIPPLVQHLMPAMHDADSRAALSGVDALYLILQACSERLSDERATNLIATVFEEVEKVRHSSVRQRVLSCIQILALHHFEATAAELLETGPDFNTSVLGALQVLAKEKALLLRLLNHFTDTLNNSDPAPKGRPNKLVQAATVALGHLFTVNDSSIGMVVKKYFPQLFGTFLLRIGTTAEGLCAQQTAAAFMNFLHASGNESMAMALEGNRLSRVNRELYDEVISELAGLFCRHHPGKRELLLQFMHPATGGGFLERPFPGHRVATVAALSQIVGSSRSNGGGNFELESMASVVQSLLKCVSDEHGTVRKQAMRGLGQLVVQWQQPGALQRAQEDPALRKVLPALCESLTDSFTAVQKEAVVAVQRACVVEEAPLEWRELLLGSVQRVQPLINAGDVALRGASLDLLGRLAALAGPPLAAPPPPGVDHDEAIPPHLPRGAFSSELELLVVDCVVRLEDTSSAVASAAARCLGHAVRALDISAAAAAEAQELLQRRLQEQTGFEQFVFPFVALLNRRDRPELLVRRLEICRVHLAPRGRTESVAVAAFVGEGGESNGGRPYGLSTCAAAGFVAAALVRCLGASQPRPTSLLCHVVRDLVDLMDVEDAEFRVQVARTLGFFDALTATGGA